MTGPYDDIIHLPHPVSGTHPQMSSSHRAAQFSPFAALTGHDAAIRETARLTNQRIALDEDAKTALEMKLNMLQDMAADHPQVAITYFQPDDRKTGGSYVTATGAIKNIDTYERAIVLMDGLRIAIEDTLEIESELFNLAMLDDFSG